MNYKGKEYVLLKKGLNYSVQPFSEELDALVWAVSNWPLDDEVTHALRGHGFGGDGFGVSFPNDVNNDWEFEELGIKLTSEQVYVRHGFEDDYYIFDLDLYLECLRQVLLLNNLADRADTIARFKKKRSYANQLVEANVDLCRYRFIRLAGILEELGWKKNEESIVNKYLYLDGSRLRIYYENTRRDIYVFLRDHKRRLEDYQRSPETSDVFKELEGLRSVIKGVNILLEREKKSR